MTVRNADPNWQEHDGMVLGTGLEFSRDHVRTVRSVAGNGTIFIKDGNLSDGRPMPRLKRC